MVRKRASKQSKRSKPAADAPKAPPELVVVMRPQAALRASAGRFKSAAGENVSDVAKLLARHGATLKPIFGPTEERVMARQAAQSVAAQAPMEDLSVFYKVEVPDERVAELRAQLAKSELVEAAFVKPAVELPRINDMAAAPEEPPPATPDLTARQIFLNAAPSGIDARWAWTQAGGRGRDIRIIDIEGEWRFTHEDLTQNQGGVVAGTTLAGVDWRNHGTAVLGEYSGDVNTVGVVGISAEATASAVSHGTHRFGRGHQPGGVAAARRRHHPARDAPARPALQFRQSRRPARLHRRRMVARRLRRDPQRHQPRHHRRRSRGQRRGESRRRAVSDPRHRLPGRLAQLVPAHEPRFGRDRRRRRRAAARHARPRSRTRSIAPRFLELGRAHRRAGLGPRGDDAAVTAICRAARTKISGTPTRSAAPRAHRPS